MARLGDVVPNSVIQVAQDERFLDNGNWIPVIDGYAIPTAVEVEDDPVAAQYTEIQTDVRREPDAYLRYYQQNYKLRLHLASIQATILDKVLGLGAFRRNQTDTNKARQIGDPTALPTQPHGMEWYLMKIGDGDSPLAASASGTILRTTFSDLSPAAADWKAALYVPASTPPAAFVAATDVLDLDAEVALVNAYVGTFQFAALSTSGGTPDVPAGAIFRFDPGTVYTVKTSVETLPVDRQDPLLLPGDFCVIVGLSYKASQAANSSDYSYVQPDGRRKGVFMDLYRPLGDAPNSAVWERRRYYNVEQTMMPGASTSGSRPDANRRVYEFIVRELTSRFRTSWDDVAVPLTDGDRFSRFYEMDFILVG